MVHHSFHHHDGIIDHHADAIVGYRDYVSKASAFIGIDVAQAANAYVQLAQSSAMRQRMGAQGRERARQEYDWAKLIPRYMTLFTDLAKTREEAKTKHHSIQTHAGSRHPRRSDPFHSFSHYPSTTLSAEIVLHPGPLLASDTAQRQATLTRQLERPIYSKLNQQLNATLLAQVIEQVANHPDGFDLRQLKTSEATHHLQRQVGWLIKAGLVHMK